MFFVIEARLKLFDLVISLSPGANSSIRTLDLRIMSQVVYNYATVSGVDFDLAYEFL
jgi:hypothetical protein